MTRLRVDRTDHACQIVSIFSARVHMYTSASLQEERSCVAGSSEVPPSHCAKFGCLCGFMLHNRTSSIIQSFPIPSFSPSNSNSFRVYSEPDHSKDRTKVPRETMETGLDGTSLLRQRKHV